MRGPNNKIPQRHVIYLTRARLMIESERTVQHCASDGEQHAQRACQQLIADMPRYSLWHARHAGHMDAVAAAKQRERQILALRAVAVEHVHRAALVRYLRDNRIVGRDRDQTLREFYGVADPRDSAIAEHKNYLIAASTQLCAADILELIGDERGIDLIRRYELSYTQYFGMFCDHARAARNRAPYMLTTLLPEVRDGTERLRLRILDSHLVPVKTIRAG